MSDILIEHQCPQCGAPITLRETDRLVTCAFCRVRSYLLEDDFFHYRLPSAAPEDQDLFYYPYWRFKGMLFWCLESGTQHRFIDASHQAVASPHFPISVGLRSQTLKMRFATAESGSHHLKPSLPLAEAMDLFQRRFCNSPPNPIYHQTHIGESLSVIYTPFYVKGQLYDAVLNRPLSSRLGADFEASRLPGGPPEWRVDFIPAICPHCGWDLSGRRNALVLICTHCSSIWRPAPQRLAPLHFACLPSKWPQVIYLPFWRIKVQVSGTGLEADADPAWIANLPSVMRKACESGALRLWSPAFKISPRVFLRLMRLTTLAQPPEVEAGKLPDAGCRPVTLSIQAALKSLKLNLAGLVRPRKAFMPDLGAMAIRPEDYLLVFIPFIEQHHELIQPQLRLTVHRNQLSMAENL